MPSRSLHDFVSRRALGVDASGIRKVFDLAAKMKDPINFSIGLPDFEASTWYGALAPTGTPSAVVDKLDAAFSLALEDPGLHDDAAPPVLVYVACVAPATDDAFALIVYVIATVTSVADNPVNVIASATEPVYYKL